MNKRNPDHPEYATALELKDELDVDDRTTIVVKVVHLVLFYVQAEPNV